MLFRERAKEVSFLQKEIIANDTYGSNLEVCGNGEIYIGCYCNNIVNVLRRTYKAHPGN